MNPTRVWSAIATAVTLAMLAALMAVDLAMDLRHGTSGFHVAVEGSAIAAAAVAIGLVASHVRGLRRQAHDLRAELDVHRADAARWRREASAFIEGLGVAIDQQFERWGLTGAEKEVALLLLKGLEHKEIAELRGVSETTVRHQARSLYRKAGLTGRHDLAAFFLEDLLGPRVTGAQLRPSRSETR